MTSSMVVLLTAGTAIARFENLLVSQSQLHATPGVLMFAVSQNITAQTCDFQDRNRGAVGTAVTFTSMGIALLFVGMHVMATTITKVWSWGDLIIWVVSVNCS
jgi:hypothetical protein